MPFKSEEQRRYLWANEPEIARDWTDTYGSKIHAANGGIMRLPFQWGGPGSGRDEKGYQSSHPSHSSQRNTGPINVHADTAPVVQQQRKTDFLNEVRRQQQEKDYQDIRSVPTDFSNYTLTGQQKINEYQPTFGQRFKSGIGNLLSGLGGGLSSLLGFLNPAAFAIKNPYVNMLTNTLAQRFAPNLFNKWNNQDTGWTDPGEDRDIERELAMKAPYDSDYLLSLQRLMDEQEQEKDQNEIVMGASDSGTGLDNIDTINQMNKWFGGV